MGKYPPPILMLVTVAGIDVAVTSALDGVKGDINPRHIESGKFEWTPPADWQLKSILLANQTSKERHHEPSR